LALQPTKELEMRHINKRFFRPTPALVVAFIALFAAMGGVGYSAVKMKANSVKTRNIKDAAVTTNKIADGAVTTPKLAPNAVAPNAANAANAMNAVNAANADKLGGVAPGHCQLGWLKASVVIDTTPLTDANPDMDVSAFDCASDAQQPVHIHRDAIGRYTVTIAGLDSGTAIAGIAGGTPNPNAIAAASTVNDQGQTAVKSWDNGVDPATGVAPFKDNRVITLLVF
jgi:hypothetical protein